MRSARFIIRPAHSCAARRARPSAFRPTRQGETPFAISPYCSGGSSATSGCFSRTLIWGSFQKASSLFLPCQPQNDGTLASRRRRSHQADREQGAPARSLRAGASRRGARQREARCASTGHNRSLPPREPGQPRRRGCVRLRESVRRRKKRLAGATKHRGLAPLW